MSIVSLDRKCFADCDGRYSRHPSTVNAPQQPIWTRLRSGQAVVQRASVPLKDCETAFGKLIFRHLHDRHQRSMQYVEICALPYRRT